MRLETVLIGIDFGSASIATAQWVAATLASRAQLVLVHVIEPPPPTALLVADTPAAGVLETIRADAANRLNEVARTIGHDVARTEVRVGRASAAIAQLATDRGAGLIVVAPHGERDHASLLLGTTADTLVRSAPVPVLVGGRASAAGRSRVIAGMASLPMSASVLTWASYAARELRGRLTILHAIEPAAYSHMASLAAAHAHGDVVAERREIDDARRRETAIWLAESAAAPLDHAQTDMTIDVGPAAEALLQYADAENAALIALGRHVGLSVFPARLGRTVRHVLHGARCAVLVVPPE